MNPFICFAHPSYRMAEAFGERNLQNAYEQAWSARELKDVVGKAEVLVISGLWEDILLDLAPKLRFVQAISAGYDQFPLEKMKRRGIYFSNARGVNRNAVAEHVMSLVLSFSRHLHLARDRQKVKGWRGLISDKNKRENELGGQTVLIVGYGSIGSRIGELAWAFGMNVMGIKRKPDLGIPEFAEVHPPGKLNDLLPEADFVVLSCPLDDETYKIINPSTLKKMRHSAVLINVSRGQCVDENALAEALYEGRIAGAGLDCFHSEPLPASSPLWEMQNVVITPHSAGETQRYEDNVVNILVENLRRLEQNVFPLVNQII